MQNLRRRDLLASVAAICLTPLASTARAQSYPAGPVKVIVPYAPGAATDNLARLLSQALEGPIGATFIVENRAGGGTQIGTKAVASAAPDGQTLGFIDTAFVINPGLFGSTLPYDTRRDFAPVSLMATAPLVLIAHSSVGVKDLKAFIELAKAQPGRLAYGSAGVGSAPHLAGEQLRRAAGIDINHAAYRGGSTVLNDLIGGHIQCGFTTVPTMVEHIRAGTVVALAVTAKSGQLPQLPTFGELGLPAVDTTPLFGMIAPAQTPAPVLQKLSQAASGAVASGPLRARLTELGFAPVGSSADAFKARIDSEIAKWTEVIKAGNIKPS
ncbi:tripartite tricarboxylate transporter substrate binding protein [Hydrogenophaga sp.]|uniref:Bug family tripartite tricarboxylate transporter substrate binding protein n=1 Tax=Hydrogenophaga sp. TaxID=1904254 RepID=UPI002720A53E|nr:tripartite tricarboxylate transporter substrate binding protein [Hydrogenophaga sp.]MDO9436544.1 tripartite tricarboxylate transporter substrate binding protein [Hydrogenophaga sp.]